MKRRYAGKIGPVGIGSQMVDLWMVIATAEVPHEEVVAAGFDVVPVDLTDDEVMSRYGVTIFYEVTDSRLRKFA